MDGVLGRGKAHSSAADTWLWEEVFIRQTFSFLQSLHPGVEAAVKWASLHPYLGTSRQYGMAQGLSQRVTTATGLQTVLVLSLLQA